MQLQDTKMPGVGTVKWEDEDTGFDLDAENSNDFAALLEDAPGGGANIREGTIVRGRVVRLTDDMVIVDIGHKSEGEIPIQEFQSPEGLRVKIGDDVDVYLDTFEDNDG